MEIPVFNGLVVALLAMLYGATKSQEGAEVPPFVGIPPPLDLELTNATGQLVVIPPVPLAYTYPGALPVPGISWPMLPGIGYIAEGRYPYNGYIGSQAPYLALLNRKYQQSSYSRPSYNSNQYGSNYNNNQPQMNQAYGNQYGRSNNNNQDSRNTNYV